MSTGKVLSGQEAQAKLYLAKQPLHGTMPLIGAFLLLYPVSALENPRVFPAYVTPKPEIVVATKAVNDLPVYKLRVLLFHEALHPAFNVFGRFMQLTGQQCVGPDWELFTVAHDMVINLLIEEEIKRLDRLQLNGQRPGQVPLLQWPGPEDGPEYSRPLLDYAFWGMPVEEVFSILKQRRKEGKSVPKPHQDCVYDESSPDQVRQGHEYSLSLLVQAAMEAATVEARENDGGLIQMVLDYAKPKDSFLTLLCNEIHSMLPVEERRTYARPDPRYDASETGGILRPGIVPVGQAVVVAIDVSDSTHADNSANRFVEEVDAALDSWQGPLRLILWDSQVRLDMMVRDRWEMRQAVQSVRSGGTTNLACVLDRLRDATSDDYGQELPEAAALVIRTDGEIPNWPDALDLPCEEVLAVYTRKAPPAHIRSLFMGAA